MSKRPYDDGRGNGGYGNGNSWGHGQGPQQKKQKDNSHRRPQQPQEQHRSTVTAPSPLPPLPPIKTDAPFRHSSTTYISRSLATEDSSYEKFEFLGDAYLELWASKLIHERLHYLPAGRMSQVREMLVKNETLAVYARAYEFDKKLRVADKQGMQAVADRGNKGFNKVLGDVFEAYVAAVCLADEKEGEHTGQEWVTALWESAIAHLQATESNFAQPTGEPTNPRTTFDPKAKEVLQKRIGYKNVKLEYVVDRPSVELKGDQLGQNRHFVALYLTGYGHEKKLLGKGEGRSKTEAGQWAAIEAMYGDMKDVVSEFEAKAKAMREMRKTDKAQTEKVEEEESAPKDLLEGLVGHLQPT